MFEKKLENCPLFAGIRPEDIQGMMGCLRPVVREADKGQTILFAGEKPHAVGVVLSGSVQIVRDDIDGVRTILGLAHSSELFAEAFACARAAELPVSVIAAEPTRVLLIDVDRILTPCSHACSFHNRIVSNLLQGMAQKSLQLHQKLQVITQRTTREKLLTYLRMQRAEQFTIPFDRQELADYLGVERSALSAEISKLRREGVLESHKSEFHLLSGGHS